LLEYLIATSFSNTGVSSLMTVFKPKHEAAT